MPKKKHSLPPEPAPKTIDESDRMRLVWIGRKLKGNRETQDLTQEQLAEKAGLGRATIVRYEAGEISRLEELQRIATALGITLDLLFSHSAVQGVATVTPVMADGMVRSLEAVANDVFSKSPEYLQWSRIAALMQAAQKMKPEDFVEFLRLARSFAIAKGYKMAITEIPELTKA